MRHYLAIGYIGVDMGIGLRDLLTTQETRKLKTKMNQVCELIWKYSWRNQTNQAIHVLDQKYIYAVESIKTTPMEMDSTVVLGKYKALFEMWK